jgi:hypothetical protein
MVLGGGMEEDSIACGGCDNYHVVGEHMCIANLFLNSCKSGYIFFEILAGWIRIPYSWIPDSWEFSLKLTSSALISFV